MSRFYFFFSISQRASFLYCAFLVLHFHGLWKCGPRLRNSRIYQDEGRGFRRSGGRIMLGPMGTQELYRGGIKRVFRSEIEFSRPRSFCSEDPNAVKYLIYQLRTFFFGFMQSGRIFHCSRGMKQIGKVGRPSKQVFVIYREKKRLLSVHSLVYHTTILFVGLYKACNLVQNEPRTNISHGILSLLSLEMKQIQER